MQRERKSIKLSDIAEELNISAVSVSNALNGKKGVSDELRQKVFDTAEELGYTRSGRKSEEKPAKQYTIGVVVAEKYIRQQGLSFYMCIYQEIVLAALNKNCMTLLEVLDSAGEEKYKMPELLSSGKADGVIILGEMKRPYTVLLKERSAVPIVFLDYYDNTPDTDFIISDSYNGMYAMTRLLIKEGFSEIGFVGKVLDTSSITDRFLGYRKALQERNIEIREDWIISEARENNRIKELKLPSRMPEAFVCHCDVAAKRLIDKLRKEGYRIPGDVGIVGFDNYLTDTVDDIQLTTYDVDVRAMAKIGVNTVIRKIERTHFVSRLRIVGGEVKIGNSHIRYKDD